MCRSVLFAKMLKLLVIVAAILDVISAVSEPEWKVFKERYGKVYGQREDFIRRMILQDNLLRINKHNEKYDNGESKFYLGLNQFGDMTTAEFAKTMNGLRTNEKIDTVKAPTPIDFDRPKANDLPERVDWRTEGYVTPVKNQGQCGGCWAFSTTGSLEGQHFKKTGKLVSLSESELLDCSGWYGNHGCNGGRMEYAYEYIIENEGIDTEDSYPYTAQEEMCKFNEANIGATMTNYAVLISASESSLQAAVATIGPISVAIDASQFSFQFYMDGVYDEPFCSTTNLDHAVLAVGYGTYNGTPYWLVKNSWGEAWGSKGYIMMSRNKKNQCGIANDASFPII